MSRRRVSRFRRGNLRNPKPGFQEGDMPGYFTILDYLGLSTVRPDTAKKLSREHHWYRCKCKCGEIEIHSQQQLSDKRRTRQCAKCTSQRRT
jgi:hypothetical protein